MTFYANDCLTTTPTYPRPALPAPSSSASSKLDSSNKEWGNYSQLLGGKSFPCQITMWSYLKQWPLGVQWLWSALDDTGFDDSSSLLKSSSSYSWLHYSITLTSPPSMWRCSALIKILSPKYYQVGSKYLLHTILIPTRDGDNDIGTAAAAVVERTSLLPACCSTSWPSGRLPMFKVWKQEVLASLLHILEEDTATKLPHTQTSRTMDGGLEDKSCLTCITDSNIHTAALAACCCCWLIPLKHCVLCNNRHTQLKMICWRIYCCGLRPL